MKGYNKKSELHVSPPWAPAWAASSVLRVSCVVRKLGKKAARHLASVPDVTLLMSANVYYVTLAHDTRGAVGM